jgi:hypothetical protein
VLELWGLEESKYRACARHSTCSRCRVDSRVTGSRQMDLGGQVKLERSELSWSPGDSWKFVTYQSLHVCTRVWWRARYVPLYPSIRCPSFYIIQVRGLHYSWVCCDKFMGLVFLIWFDMPTHRCVPDSVWQVHRWKCFICINKLSDCPMGLCWTDGGC